MSTSIGQRRNWRRIGLFVAHAGLLLPLPCAGAGSQPALNLVGLQGTCFVSDINTTSVNSTEIDDVLSKDLYQQNDGAITTVGDCAAGTNLTLTMIDPHVQTDVNTYGDPVYQLYAGDTYLFEIDLWVNATEYDVIENNYQNMEFRARAYLCNALRLGACDSLGESKLRTTVNENLSNGVSGGSVKLNGSVPLLNLQLVQDDTANVSAQTIQWVLHQSSSGELIYETSVNVTLTLPKDTHPGVYFIVGHAAIDFVRSNSSTIRLDVTDAIPNNAATVTNPPYIQYVTSGMDVYIGIAIGLVGSFGLALFAFIIYHRDHPVMRMAQGPFLAALCASCVVQTVFTFSYLPLKDVFCQLPGPLVLVPIHFGAAIMIGRTWRVYSTLSNANFIGRSASSAASKHRWHLGRHLTNLLTVMARFPRSCSCTKRAQRLPRKGSLRQAATARETFTLIIFLTLPQAVLQVFGAVYYNRNLEVQIDKDENIGRVVCQRYGRWVGEVGTGLIFIMYVCTVILAYMCRLLPSAFNEKEQVFRAAFLNTMMAFIAIPLLEFTNNANNSPDIMVFLRSFLSLGFALSVLTMIVLPKVLRVMSGEKVVVTTALGAQMPLSGHGGTNGHAVSGLDYQSPAVQPIKLKEDDPLPESVERHLIDLQQLLRRVTEKVCDGRTLSASEWKDMRRATGLFQVDLDRVELEWDTEPQQPEAQQP